jgi:tRNA A-37 threonylcarbamoyl transferase component Bud32
MIQPPCPFCGERHTLEDTCLSPRAISREELQKAQQETIQPIKPLPIFLINEPKEELRFDKDTLKEISITALEGIVREDIEPISLSQWLTLSDAPRTQGEYATTPSPPPEEFPDTEPPPKYAPSAAIAEESHVSAVEVAALEIDAEALVNATRETSANRNIKTDSKAGLGSFIGEYELVEKLGEGGMGQIFRARNARVGTEVAIKLLKPEVSSDSGVVRRFFQEARVVNEISHENVIDILDLGRTKHGEYFLLMELLKGKTLREALSAAPFAKEELLHIGEQLCAGLQACHQRGIAHRDLKSENIFLITRGAQKNFVKILDFGLAKLYKASLTAQEVSMDGMVIGTPVCMSPEQICGEEVDHQTDIYAMGILLYQMATGHPPFFDINPLALMKLHLMSAPTPPSKRGSSLGKAFDAIVLRCLEKERKRRYQSMEEVLKGLRRLR